MDGLTLSKAYTYSRVIKLEDEVDLGIISRILTQCFNVSRKINFLQIQIKNAALFKQIPFGGNAICYLDLVLDHDEAECLSLPSDLLVETFLRIRCRPEDEESIVTNYFFDLSSISIDTRENLEYVIMINIHPIMNTDGNFLMLDEVEIKGDHEALTAGINDFVSRAPRLKQLDLSCNVVPNKVTFPLRNSFSLPACLATLNQLYLKNIMIDLRDISLPELMSIDVTDANVLVDYNNPFISQLEYVSFKMEHLILDPLNPLITDIESMARMNNAGMIILDYRDYHNSSRIRGFMRAFNDGYLDTALPALKSLTLIRNPLFDSRALERFCSRHIYTSIHII